ncbi:MAG: WbuC family cupin fold metalloprotein [Bacteroidaceae bacterium]|nr:WbuC family cupin fold metalloprotein [Bacteroidaceae bacterium]
MMKIIDENLISGVVDAAKQSPRLRMNYNFHQSLDDKCHRFLNALEPGTVIPVHHHPTKDETFVILKGRVRVSTYNDDGEVIESCVISHKDGKYGVDIPKNVWHGLECLEPSVLLECKEGPFVEHEVDGILEIKNGKEIFLAGGDERLAYQKIMNELVFHQKTFHELAVDELYELLRVRSEVFVVEQNCVYQDMDNDDQKSIHLWLTMDGKVVALARVCPAGTHMQEISIGRVLTTERGKGYGKQIMLYAIEVAKEHFGAKQIDLEAQEYAKGFYESVGFKQSSDTFMLDGIPHIRMTLLL